MSETESNGNRKILFVPMHLDTLTLREKCRLAGATTDFSLMPYFNGTRNINANIANISENILTDPFDTFHELGSGVHLHWALPDALTHGHVNVEASGIETIRYPRVPNRWLVVRGDGNPSNDKCWVVESDYLYPEDRDRENNAPPPHSIKYPFDLSENHVSAGQPFRYMGRKVNLCEWEPAQSPSKSYLSEGLTAVGYGEPNFAAFYSNCFSVFGCHDELEHLVQSEKLTYEVIGWYEPVNQAEADPMINLLREYDEAGEEYKIRYSLYEHIQKEFQWEITDLDAQEGSTPEELIIADQMICFAQLELYLGEALNSEVNRNGADTRVSIHNTGTEALSSLLAEQLGSDKGTQAEIEDQLEYMQLLGKLGEHRLDLLPKFYETRHEKGFDAINGGFIWNITHLSDEEPSVQELINDLKTLNRLQKQHDDAREEIVSMQRQLYSDWYKYMLCACPPDGTHDRYPNMDAAREFIENHGMTSLEAKIRGTSGYQVEWKENEDGTLKIVDASGENPDSPPEKGSLASEIIGTIKKLLEKIKKLNVSEGEAPELKRQTAPRFWIANDPVILLEGELASATFRHGQDGRDHESGLLKCYQAPGVIAPTKENKDAFFSTLLQTVRESLKCKGGIGFHTQKKNSWNPLMLHWQSEFFPVRDTHHFGVNQYPPNFLNKHYALDRDKLEFRHIREHDYTGNPQVLSGQVILTPSGKTQLSESLTKFSEANAEPDSSNSPLAKIANVASNKLNGLNVLSQSLGGFNEALLQHKQTMQLPIDDPTGFVGSRAFTQKVKKLVGVESKSAPAPHEHFLPWRTGKMQVTQLRLVDSFGQIADLPTTDFIYPHTLNTQNRNNVDLPPRLSQPARLNFRWLDASQYEAELNSPLMESPICGWLVQNLLDESIMIYDHQGQGLGLVGIEGKWKPVPGQDWVIDIDFIANERLRNVVKHLTQACFPDFFRQLVLAMESIDPENHRQHPELALLIGKPIAVVRAQVNLQLKGKPAINQNWPAFLQDLKREGRRTTEAFESIKVPVHIGTGKQFNDGVLGYWREDESFSLSEEFFPVDGENSELHLDFSSGPQFLTLLMDPKAKAHVSCGLFPTKVLDIPAKHYVAALQNIAISFKASPILTPNYQISISLPNEAGFQWSWLQKRRLLWQEASLLRELNKQDLAKNFRDAEALWNALVELNWIEEVDVDTAKILPESKRVDTAPEGSLDFFEQQKQAVEHYLDQAVITPALLRANFPERAVIREGWLKLSPTPAKNKNN